MEKIQILGICRNPVVLQKLLRFINENPQWEGTGTVDDTSAIAIFNQKKYDIVLYIDYLTEASKEKLDASFTSLHPEVKLITHFGDSTGLLASEIFEAMNKPQDKHGKLLSE